MTYLPLLQEGPAETTAYMIAGYAVVFVVMAVYLVSLWLRWRNLEGDRNTLEGMLPKEQSDQDS